MPAEIAIPGRALVGLDPATHSRSSIRLLSSPRLATRRAAIRPKAARASFSPEFRRADLWAHDEVVVSRRGAVALGHELFAGAIMHQQRRHRRASRSSALAGPDRDHGHVQAAGEHGITNRPNLAEWWSSA